MELSGNAIRRARLPHSAGRHGSLRSTVERWLGAQDPRRYGLPADAIVVVRGVRAGWAELGDDAGRIRQDALATVVADARRPAHDGVGAASAVWFSDTAEMLACMARDALDGPLAANWWWSTLLRDRTDPAALFSHWIGSARDVPRAVERLQSMPAGAAWLERWDGTSRSRLLWALARHYPLSPAVGRLVEHGIDPSTPPADLPPPGDSRPAPAAGADPAAARESGRPAASGSPATRLQRLCLLLARDPAGAADLGSFLRKTTERRRVRRIEPSVQGAAAVAVVETGRSLERSGDPPDATAIGFPAATFDARPTPVGSTRVSAPPVFAAEPMASPTRRSEAMPDGPASGDASVAVRTPVSADARPAPDAGPDAAATVIESGHAGVFFVVDAALHLGLYGDFSRPQHRGLAVSPYRFLHDVGRAIGKRRFLRDPLAAWLAAQADAADGEPRAQRRTPVLALAYLRARLALALGLADPRCLASQLLRVPGRIRAIDGRIDVSIRLCDLPLAVRLAGLDRDPGWLPAAGRELRFHFE